MIGTYVELHDQKNEFGTVFLNVENFTFYLFFNEQYCPDPQIVKTISLDQQNTFLTPYVTFNNFKLVDRTDTVIKEGVAIQLRGNVEPMSETDIVPDDNFDKDGKINWQPYVFDVLRLTELDGLKNYEKVIVIYSDCSTKFLENSIEVFNSVNIQVLFRRANTIYGLSHEGVSYYGYKDVIPPETEFNCFDLETVNNPEKDCKAIIPYDNETWKKLIELTNQNYNYIDKIEDIIEEKKL